MYYVALSKGFLCITDRLEDNGDHWYYTTLDIRKATPFRSVLEADAHAKRGIARMMRRLDGVTYFAILKPTFE